MAAVGLATKKNGANAKQKSRTNAWIKRAKEFTSKS